MPGIERTGTAALGEFQRKIGALDLSEIGSREGLSANFMLRRLPAASLTCVDAWEGPDEHRDGSGTHADALDEVERRLDVNCRPFADRIVKRAQRSSRRFAGPVPQERSARVASP